MGLRLTLTGRPDLTDGAGRSIRLPRKAFILAAFMLIDPAKKPLSRERAARFLWEDTDPARRAGNLRQLLARVRDVQATEGVELFVVGPDHVALDADVAEIDVALLLQARAETTDRRLFDLCKAYSGDLLFGLDEGGEEFTRWLWTRRAMLREQFVAVVAANLEASFGALDPEEVIFVARRLIEADQYQEAAYRALMRVHAARGEFETALRIHRRLADLLRETNGRPSTETAALLADILDRSRPGAEAAAEAEPFGGATLERAAPASRPPQTMQLPRLALAVPGLADLAPMEREWAEALFDDAAIQLWRTRSFVLTRPADVRPRSIDLLDRARRDPCDYVVDCRLASRDGRPLLTTSLVCSSTGEIMWICRFDFGEPIARAVHELVVNCVHHIEAAELRALSLGPERASAYRLTLQGSRLLRAIDLRSIRRARQVFRTALSSDVEHAPSLAAISKAYRLEWLLLARADDKELDLAIDFARQSIAVSPDGAHGLHQLGICNIYKKNFELGLDALARAERYMPFEEELVADHADGLISAGLINEGLRKIAPLLEDRFVVSDQVLWIAASGQYLTGRYEEALATLERLSSQEPTYQLRAACHALLAQPDEARRYVRKLHEILPDFTVSSRLGMVPLRRSEDLEHYEFGLRTAGFD